MFVNVFVRSFSSIDDVKMVREFILLIRVYIWGRKHSFFVFSRPPLRFIFPVLVLFFIMLNVVDILGIQFSSDSPSAVE